MSGPKHTPATARIQARLDRLTLEHLRELVAEQAERIAQLEAQVPYLEDQVDFWHRSYHDLAEHFDNDTADGRCIGLTQSGDLLVVSTGAIQ